MPKFLGKVEFPVTIEQGRGMEGAISNVTRLGYVDGEAGELNYRGYMIQDLCAASNYEETAFLLFYGHLPTAAELAAFQKKLRSSGQIPKEVKQIIASMPRDAQPMNVMQSAVAALGCFDKDALVVTDHTSDPGAALETEREVGIRVLARTSTIGAAIARAREGRSIIDPDPSLSFTDNYVYMMAGEKPNEVVSRVVDVCLILQADHGMNASTFTAMVVHSSLSDMYSTCAAAIGSLRGPLHGGANEAALHDLLAIGGPSKAAAWAADRMARHEKVIGFGHRVYKALDPRAVVLKGHAEALCRDRGMKDLFETADIVEREVTKAMEREGRKIYPNVDFYSGVVYHALGFPPPLYPVIFAVARTAGWVARVLEYLPENRIFRPRAVYDGPVHVAYVPIEKR
jgi:citrate synthase